MIDLIGRASLPIDIFTLDTGLLFPETYALKQQIEERYGVTLRAVNPAHTVDQQAEREGPELWERDPDRCCELRKMEPLRATLATYEAWITAIRRDQTPERANAPVVGWDGAVRPDQDQSARPLDARRGQSLRHASTTFRTIRCTIATTRASAACRAPARWPLARIRAPGAGAGAKRRSAACISSRNLKLRKSCRFEVGPSRPAHEVVVSAFRRRRQSG